MVLGPIAVKLVQALHFLHEEMRVIHLDVKPENILCSLAGDVKISDFGASRQLKQNSGWRLQVQGTLYYMSPERIDGREHFFDSDCWSLGVTLLEAAIGHYPFAVSDAEKKELIFWDLRHRIVAQPWRRARGGVALRGEGCQRLTREQVVRRCRNEHTRGEFCSSADCRDQLSHVLGR